MDKNFIRGTCQTMCSKKEAFFRQREKLLHKFEIKAGTECNKYPQFDPEKVIKCFNRSSAGAVTPNPSELRPFPVLLKTIHYLFENIFPLHKDKPLLVYDFMFDRFRAIRQDAIVQNLPSEEIICIFEPIVRFLIYFGYLLIEENLNNYDPYINSKHLQECVSRLLASYNECDDDKIRNRWDIESAYILLNLGDINALTRGIKLCESNTNLTYKKSVQLSLHWYVRNYIRVIADLRKLPPLLLCVISLSLSEIRQYALRAMSYAYSSLNSAFPVSHLCWFLMYDSESEAEDDCTHFNIKVNNGQINFLKKDFNSSIKCKPSHKLKWINEKLSECDVTLLLCYGNK